LRLDIQLPIKLDDSANQSNKTHPEEALEKRPLRVLVAEDNPINARVISLMLEHLGARFIVVHNGKEAVNAFAQDETGFDLVLMDCQMPDLDGFDATREIREFEQDRATRTKIVAMTAYALPGDKEACLAAGMDDYLSKPISSRQLSAVLNQELS
jgi:CheY-like chemotaxis protein